ncbi:MAG TPA: ribbon-helix-helix domain-containing protein [Gammaproteobacteria bacterium]|nr:ribbon-helix-helix domain-containing protein [Gammaproteobacteria bacterium]
MSVAKIAVSIDAEQLKKIDYYVKKHVFKTRSEAFRIAINQTLDELEHNRLARECSKLEISEEQEMADQGLEEDLGAWPKY